MVLSNGIFYDHPELYPTPLYPELYKSSTEFIYDNFRIILNKEILEIYVPASSNYYIERFNKGEINRALTYISKLTPISKEIKIELLNIMSIPVKIVVDEVELRAINDASDAVILNKSIIDGVVSFMDDYIGEEYFKKIYVVAVLSIGIKNVDAPLHLHAWGPPEAGKTELQTRFKRLIPKGHKSESDGFSDRALIYDELKEGCIISLNDKVFNDGSGKLLNNVCDSVCWSHGYQETITIDGANIVVKIPPRTLFLANSNKQISDYEFKEVSGEAVESKFQSFKKSYTQEEKDFIWDNKGISVDRSSVAKVLSAAIFKYIHDAKIINICKEMRVKIRLEAKKIGIITLRNLGQLATTCQVFAMIDQRNDVNDDDIKNTMDIYTSQKNVAADAKELSVKVLSKLIPLKMFTSLKDETKQNFNLTNLRNTIKTAQYNEVKQAIAYLIATKQVDSEHIKAKNNKSYECFYRIDIKEYKKEDASPVIKQSGETINIEEDMKEFAERQKKYNEEMEKIRNEKPDTKTPESPIELDPSKI